MGADPDAFAAELAALKRRGCNLLVTDVPGDVALCEELLGDENEPRKRIVVNTADGRHDTPSDDRVVVEVGERFMRSAASTAPTTDPVTAERDLYDVLAEIRTHVEQFEDEGLEPGELRVCLGDLATLAVGEDPDTLLDFLAGVTDLVRDASGMGHVHAPPDTTTRERIETTFDVTIDLRTTSSGRQYRWRLHEAELDSGWIPLD